MWGGPSLNFPYSVIRYILSGTGAFISGGQTIRLQKGMAAWCMPDVLTVINTDEDTRLISYTLIVLGTEVREMFMKHLGSPQGAANLWHPQEVQSIMEEIMVEGLSGSPCVAGNCADLSRVLLRRIKWNTRTMSANSVAARETYQRCKAYIDKSLSAMTDLQQVADACGVTKVHISRLFARFANTTPYTYITELRMHRARQLLVDPSLSVAEVAKAVGYDSPRSFSRNFKALFGQSARKFKHQFSQ